MNNPILLKCFYTMANIHSCIKQDQDLRHLFLDHNQVTADTMRTAVRIVNRKSECYLLLDFRTKLGAGNEKDIQQEKKLFKRMMTATDEDITEISKDLLLLWQTIESCGADAGREHIRVLY